MKMKTKNKIKPLYTEEVGLRTMLSPQITVTYAELNLYGTYVPKVVGEPAYVDDVRVTIGFPGEEVDVENAEIEDYLIEAFLDGYA